MVRDPFTAPEFVRQRTEEERPAPLGVPAVTPVTNVVDANVTLYTAPKDPDRYAKIHHVAVVNMHTAATAITVYKVPSGGAAAAGNTVYNGYSVAANASETLAALTGDMLEPGDFLVADTDQATNGANFWLWVEELEGGMPTT